MDRLHEAVEVIDQLMRNQPLTYHGTYYKLHEAPLVPAPVQQPRPPLFVAANGRRALRIVAEHADGWVSLGKDGASMEDSLAALRARNSQLDEHCSAAGRDPRTVERAYFVGWRWV